MVNEFFAMVGGWSFNYAKKVFSTTSSKTLVGKFSMHGASRRMKSVQSHDLEQRIHGSHYRNQTMHPEKDRGSKLNLRV